MWRPAGRAPRCRRRSSRRATRVRSVRPGSPRRRSPRWSSRGVRHRVEQAGAVADARHDRDGSLVERPDHAPREGLSFLLVDLLHLHVAPLLRTSCSTGGLNVLVEAEEVRRIVFVLEGDQALVVLAVGVAHQALSPFEEAGEVEVYAATGEAPQVRVTIPGPRYVRLVVLRVL